jgi:DNA invertase Pin-like site-specific DNA recombinase
MSTTTNQKSLRFAYSYIRFSKKKQAKGDSLRRQTELAEAYCQRRGWKLDTTLTLHDLGVSAFRGKNALVGNLRVFLDEVKRGTVRPGSVLIVESVDRISRQGIDEGWDIIKGILKAGIRLVTLTPEREFDESATKSLTKGALEIQLILERAAEESERKSERCAAAWVSKRARARADKTVETTGLPKWLKVWGDRGLVGAHMVGGEYRLIPERARVVKRIFALAIKGYGIRRIVQQLTAEGHQPWGGATEWSKSYVFKILTNRAVLGERQYLKGDKPEGDPIPGYFPAVIDQATWDRAQGALASRAGKPGRVGHKVASLFTHLCKDALTRSPLRITWESHGRGKGRERVPVRVLKSKAAMEGHAPARTFRYQFFEDALLSCLKEVNPSDVTGEEPPSESAPLAERLAAKEAQIRVGQDKARAAGENAGPILELLAEWYADRQDLLRHLTAARQREANPPATAWGEFKGLLPLAQQGEDTRLRLRKALRTIIKEIWMLVVPRGKHRLAYVQVYFRGKSWHESRRDYYIHAWAGGYGRREESGWEVRSHVSTPGFLELGDLRDVDSPHDIADVTRRSLEQVPLELLFSHVDARS